MLLIKSRNNLFCSDYMSCNMNQSTEGKQRNHNFASYKGNPEYRLKLKAKRKLKPIAPKNILLSKLFDI